MPLIDKLHVRKRKKARAIKKKKAKTINQSSVVRSIRVCHKSTVVQIQVHCIVLVNKVISFILVRLCRENFAKLQRDVSLLNAVRRNCGV